jgi:hypothetical protein
MRASLLGDFPANKAFWRGCPCYKTEGIIEEYSGLRILLKLHVIAGVYWRSPGLGQFLTGIGYTSTRKAAGGHVIPIVVPVVNGEMEKLGSKLIQRLAD